MKIDDKNDVAKTDSTPGDILELFHNIFEEFSSIRSNRGRITEADTRASLLDKLIHNVLGWPSEAVRREVYSEAGFLDYELHRGLPILVIEAKAVGETFEFPSKKHKSPQRLKIKGIISGIPGLLEALEQAQRYCNERGIRYALVTNGYSFVLFRAIMEGQSWREGEAIAFESPRVIAANFTEFTNLLSYESVASGRLDDAFRLVSAAARPSYRPIQGIVDADASYARNTLTALLRPYTERYFGDLADDEDELDVLKECYVYSRPLQVIDEELQIIVEDYVPKRFADALRQLDIGSSHPTGALEETVRTLAAVSSLRGSVILLVGGIGAGKTTFLRRFFSIVAPDLATSTSNSFFIPLDLLGKRDETSGIERFIWQSCADVLRRIDPMLSTRETLEILFRPSVTILRGIYKDDPIELSRRLNSKLEELANDGEVFAKAALRRYAEDGRRGIVVLDNVDQLSFTVQAHIFTIAEFFARDLGCLCMVGLREETYSSNLMQRQLTAYRVRAFHLSSPSFQELLQKRLEYARKAATAARDTGGVLGSESKDIVTFFQLLRSSFIGRRKGSRTKKGPMKLLESVAYGNMRFALEMFNNFVTSGAADTAKMLSNVRREGGYYQIPLHEFTKSVILGQYRFYREGRSAIANLFDVTPGRNASHFTALRVLSFLSGNIERHAIDQGFVPLHSLIASFVDVFDNEEDCIRTIEKLIVLRRQLLELDTRRTESLAGASAVRITSAGQYYFKHLLPNFSYLDLVWHDTPFVEFAVCDALRAVMHETHMDHRFTRVENFLSYLTVHEERELQRVGLANNHSIYGPFVPRLTESVARQKSFIFERLGLPLADSGDEPEWLSQ